MKHQCQALVIRCMDFRFRKATIKFVEDKIKGDFDDPTQAGGVKNVDFIVEHVKIAKENHKIQEVYLFNHQDCTAYGGSQNFKSFEEEREFHRQVLNRAKAFISYLFPGLKVYIFYAHFGPREEILFEEVE